MTANTTPKFWFDVDGRKFGARLLTIAEQAQVQVEVERQTNGNFATWLAATNPVLINTAVLIQVACTLNKVLVAWPTDLPAHDLLGSDDQELLMKLWEAYGAAADTFRGVKRQSGEGGAVGGEVSAPPLVP